MKNYIIGIFGLVIFIFLSYHFWTAVNFDNIKYVKIGGQEIEVELALTTEKQSEGLSGRSELLENSGMLFVFDKPGKYNFWMKDMNFAINIIWISEDMKVVYIKKDATPLSYPEIFSPDVDAKYVLEVVSGFSEKNNLKVGDSVEFLFTSP